MTPAPAGSALMLVALAALAVPGVAVLTVKLERIAQRFEAIRRPVARPVGLEPKPRARAAPVDTNWLSGVVSSFQD